MIFDMVPPIPSILLPRGTWSTARTMHCALILVLSQLCNSSHASTGPTPDVSHLRFFAALFEGGVDRHGCHYYILASFSSTSIVVGFSHIILTACFPTICWRSAQSLLAHTPPGPVLGPVQSATHPRSGTAQARIPNTQRALYPVFQQITNLIVASHLLVLYRQTKFSMKTRPCPSVSLRSLYFLVLVDRAPRTSIPITITNLLRTWVRMLHLGDQAATPSPRNHSSQVFLLGQGRLMPLLVTPH